MTELKTYEVLSIVVDTNDADYEAHVHNLDDDTEHLEVFLNILNKLPKTENYYYCDGKKVVTGDKIRFDNNVGNDSIHGRCGLKDMIIDQDEYEDTENPWTDEEVYQEGMILPNDYEILSDYLPMWIEGGFHSIISVKRVLHTEAVVLEEYL